MRPRKGFKYIEPKVVPVQGVFGGLAIAKPPEEGAAPAEGSAAEPEEGALAPKPAPLPPCLPGNEACKFSVTAEFV